MAVTARDARAGPVGVASTKAIINAISDLKGRMPSPFTFLESAMGSRKTQDHAKAMTK